MPDRPDDLVAQARRAAEHFNSPVLAKLLAQLADRVEPLEGATERALSWIEQRGSHGFHCRTYAWLVSAASTQDSYTNRPACDCGFGALLESLREVGPDGQS